MRFLEFLWIIVWLPSIFSTCDESFDEETCMYNINCKQNYDDHDYSYNRYSHINCISDINGVYKNGEYWYPINLHFEITANNFETGLFISNNNDNNERISNVLISLDLSHQNYVELTEFPKFNTLENLIMINISENKIKEAIFSNKKELISLEEIDYSQNEIQRIIKNNNEFVFKKLKKIDLSYNKINDISQELFEDFKDLEYLDLSHNHIEALNEMTFYGVRKLLLLHLSYNEITDINSAFLMLNNLIELTLDHNEIRTIRETDFKNLRYIRKLDLNFNSISKIDHTVFHNMTYLSIILISNNLIQKIDEDVFIIKNLTEVDLSNNDINTLPRNLFKENYIRNFSLVGNKLQGSLQKGMFEGLVYVKVLDLSHQNIYSIEDYAFDGMSFVEIITLNNNFINFIGDKAFQNLHYLVVLNLCNNKVTQVNLNDLIHLRTLLLGWNFITELKNVNIVGLHYFDVSNNNISNLDSNAFRSLRDLTTFNLKNNPLNGALENNSFFGLSSLPNLDISCTLLTLIKNNSFYGMKKLKGLNISHSEITELQYNAFSNTGNIEEIDFSHNHIEIFSLNSTSLVNLRKLLINNNNIKHITQSTFAGLHILDKLLISYNNIETINNNAFIDQTEMKYLDMSYNTNFTLDVSLFGKTNHLNNLLLSGIPLYNFSFSNIVEFSVTKLSLSYSAITDIKKIYIKRLVKLQDLYLSNNELTKLEIGSFSNMSNLNRLDVSFNKINWIQPGVFKDNNDLISLNVSHNSLLSLSYGIFRGLGMLNTLDISYNNINNLAREKFSELVNMKILIADYNKIEYISVEELPNLDVLSIGGNPLPCNLLVKLQKADANLLITAIIMDESSDNALIGITCGNSDAYTRKQKVNITTGTNNVVNDIKEILQTIASKMDIGEPDILRKSTYLDIISSQMNKSVVNNNKKLSDISSAIVNEIKLMSNNLEIQNNNTYMLLDKMLRVLTSINSIRRAPVMPASGNITDTNLINYINKMKQDLEDTVAIEKHNMLNEVDKKIAMIKSQVERKETVNDKLIANRTGDKGYLFTEICVALILVIILLFCVYKLYKSRFVQSRRTPSTFQINADSLQL